MRPGVFFVAGKPSFAKDVSNSANSCFKTKRFFSILHFRTVFRTGTPFAYTNAENKLAKYGKEVLCLNFQMNPKRFLPRRKN